MVKQSKNNPFCLFLLRSIFLLGIFLLPFVCWPWAEIPFEIPKVVFFQRWVEVLGVLGIINLLTNPGSLVKKERNQNFLPILLVILFVITAFFSSFLGIDFLKSFWGNYYRWDGLLTLFHSGVLFFLFAIYWEKTWEQPFLKTVATSSLLLGLGVILIGWLTDLWIGKFWVLPTGRQGFDGIGFTFGQPNFLAGYLLVTFPLTIYWLRKRSVLKIIGVMIYLSAVYLTGSKVGILGIFFLSFCWLFLSNKRWLKKGLTGLMAVALLIFLTGFLKGGKNDSFIAESRERIYKKASLAFLEKPVLGWGWANFDYAFDSVTWPIKFDNDVYVDKAHAYFLEVLVTTGISGLILLIMVTWVTTKQLLKRKKTTFYSVLLVSFVVFVVHSQTNIISINEEIMFWTILGISASLNSSG